MDRDRRIMMPIHSTCRREAPVASMASAVSLPTKPIERAAIAQIPATGPGPKMDSRGQHVDLQTICPDAGTVPNLTNHAASMVSRPGPRLLGLRITMSTSRPSASKRRSSRSTE